MGTPVASPSPFHLIFSPTYEGNEAGEDYRTSEGYGSLRDEPDADEEHLYSDLDESNGEAAGRHKKDASTDNEELYQLHYTDNAASRSYSHDELSTALAKLEGVQEEVKQLRSEKESYLKEKAILEKNFSSLLMTARANLERKDRQLKDLQKEYDNVVFRRGKSNNRISREMIERLAEEKARIKIEAVSREAKEVSHKETKDGDVIYLTNHTNCRVAMGNVIVSFATDHFGFAASRRPVEDAQSSQILNLEEVSGDEELPCVPERTQPTESATSKVASSTSSKSKASKETKPHSRTTKSKVRHVRASSPYVFEKPAEKPIRKRSPSPQEKSKTAPVMEPVTSTPEKSRRARTPRTKYSRSNKPKIPSARAYSSPKKRARVDSGDIRPASKRRVSSKHYAGRRKDSENTVTLPHTLETIPNPPAQEMEEVSHLPSAPRTFNDPRLILDEVTNSGRLVLPLASVATTSLERLDLETRDLETNSSLSPFIASSVASNVTRGNESSESFQSLVAAAAAVLAASPAMMNTHQETKKNVELEESLPNNNTLVIESELEEGELTDDEDTHSEQIPGRSQSSQSDTAKEQLVRSGEKNRNDVGSAEKYPAHSSHRESSDHHRDGTSSRLSVQKRFSAGASIRVRSAHTSSQRTRRSPSPYRSECCNDKRQPENKTVVGTSRPRESLAKSVNVKRRSEEEASASKLDPLDLQRLLGKSRRY